MNSEAGRLSQGDVAFQARLYEDPNPTRRGLHRDRRQWIVDRIARFSKKGDRAIEVGIGCGVFVDELAAHGLKVDAVDINPAFLDNVKNRPSVQVFERDATRPLDLEAHDLALCTEVLEHVPPQSSQAMIETLFGTLKPGGTLILTTPQSFSTVEMMSRLFRFKPVLALARKIYGQAEELGHINLLTAGAVEAQWRKAGFELVDQARFGFYLPVVAEFGGKAGWSALRGTGRTLAKLPVLRGLLWTQAWVLRRPA